MAKALGIGGVFFKCKDAAALGTWYERWLGMPLSDYGGVTFQPATLPAHAYSVWGPFDAATDYFDPSNREFMFNLIVDHIEGALEQVAEGGATVVGDIEEYEYGRFGWFIDPEGNKVELWEPPAE